MTKTTTRRSSGFTLIELLIAVIIIGILVAIIVPVLSNRASDARLAAAQSDLDAIANAQSQVAIDTGFFVRLHVIDDVKSIGDGIGSGQPNDVVDALEDEQNHGQATQPTLVFLDIESGFSQTATYARAIADLDRFKWRGPYINYIRKFKFPLVAPNPPDPILAYAAYGQPLDPWGNPYLLFVGGRSRSGQGGTQDRGGIINEPDFSGNPGISIAIGGNTYNAQVFDRPTVLSMGPNGLPGDGTAAGDFGTGDDIIRQF